MNNTLSRIRYRPGLRHLYIGTKRKLFVSKKIVERYCRLSSLNLNPNIDFLYCIFFGRLECVGHSFTSWFLRDVWTRTQKGCCDKQARYQFCHPSPCLATHPVIPMLSHPSPQHVRVFVYSELRCRIIASWCWQVFIVQQYFPQIYIGKKCAIKYQNEKYFFSFRPQIRRSAGNCENKTFAS
jgi:hypothetical protein